MKYLITLPPILRRVLTILFAGMCFALPTRAQTDPTGLPEDLPELPTDLPGDVVPPSGDIDVPDTDVEDPDLPDADVGDPDLPDVDPDTSAPAKAPPYIQTLMDATGATGTQVDGLRDSGYGWGNVKTAISLADRLVAESEGTVTLEEALTDITTLRRQGEGWGAIARSKNLKVGDLLGNGPDHGNARVTGDHDSPTDGDLTGPGGDQPPEILTERTPRRRSLWQRLTGRQRAEKVHTRDGSVRPAAVARAEQGGRPERTGRPERVGKPEKPARVEKVERPQRPEKPEKPGKVERPERVEKIERVARVERPERLEKPVKPEKPEKIEKPEKPERPGRGQGR
jgi:hypothetical protein